MRYDDPLIEAMFKDPRYRHLLAFAEVGANEPDDENYDKAMTLQAASAVYAIQSAEKQSRTLARATWGLVIATIGLVLATVVLVIVTVRA